MKRIIVWVIVFQFAFYASLTNAEESPVVAKIADRKITASDLDHIISLLDENRQKILKDNPEMKKTFLQRWVKAMIISRIAKEEGFDKKPDIREFVDFITNDYIASEYLTRILKEDEITENDVRLYYDTHRDEFKTAEMVKARHILIKVDRCTTEEEKNKAREITREILKRIKAGESFEKLALEFSDDTRTKNKGGDLGYIRRGMMVPAFENALFELGPGEVSDIVETNFGFHIIKVDEKKGGEVESFDKVKEIAKRKATEMLRNTKAREFVEKALKDADVEFYFDSIPGVKSSTHK